MGSYYVEFKPIHNDWYSWVNADGELKILHEKCYYAIATNHKEALGHAREEGVCAKCGVEAPESVKQFVLLANGVHSYESTIAK